MDVLKKINDLKANVEEVNTNPQSLANLAPAIDKLLGALSHHQDHASILEIIEILQTSTQDMPKARWLAKTFHHLVAANKPVPMLLKVFEAYMALPLDLQQTTTPWTPWQTPWTNTYTEKPTISTAHPLVMLTTYCSRVNPDQANEVILRHLHHPAASLALAQAWLIRCFSGPQYAKQWFTNTIAAAAALAPSSIDLEHMWVSTVLQVHHERHDRHHRHVALQKSLAWLLEAIPRSFCPSLANHLVAHVDRRQTMLPSMIDLCARYVEISTLTTLVEQPLSSQPYTTLSQDPRHALFLLDVLFANVLLQATDRSRQQQAAQLILKQAHKIFGNLQDQSHAPLEGINPWVAVRSKQEWLGKNVQLLTTCNALIEQQNLDHMLTGSTSSKPTRAASKM